MNGECGSWGDEPAAGVLQKIIMPEELVTIAHEFSPLKANLMRTRLEADGIECFLQGETLTGVVGSLSYASASWNHPEGNITLRVHSEDSARATEILSEFEAEKEKPEVEDFSSPIFWFIVKIMGAALLAVLVAVGVEMIYLGIGQWVASLVFLVLAYFIFKPFFKSES